MGQIKKIFRWVIGPNIIELLGPKKGIYLCDPITALIVSLGAGAAAMGTAAIAKKGKGDKSGEASAVAQPAAQTTDVGKVTDVGSLEQQAAQRRLARLSKYFTTPTGVMDTPTGSSQVF